MDMLPLSRAMGLPHLELHLYQGHTFLLSLWSRENGSHQGDGSWAQLALASKLSGSHDRIGDIEAIKERRHNMENK